MRFPLLDQLELPCIFERFVPGRLHPDGRRYLPQILLRPTGSAEALPAGLLLSVVDRHHRVAAGDEGRAGSARLVCALSHLRLRAHLPRRGLVPEASWRGGVSAGPTILGQVVAIGAWEAGGSELAYETLYTELALDIGLGIVGLRTTLTATSLADAIGKSRVEPGDFVELTHSRIDILEFVP